MGEYFDPNEPTDEAEIRRYLTMFKIQKLMANEELFFARPDKLSDTAEGIPSEESVAALARLNRYDLKDRQEINHTRGSFAQFRENYFISCWTLHAKETYRMWKEYAPHGLAICSRYGLLKSALSAQLDEIHLGRVKYGKDQLPRPGNVFCEIATKGSDFSWESEIRALLYWPSVLSSGNLHFDADNRAHPEVLPENRRYHWNHA